jgi:UDP-sugar transporter A1/2/3
MISILTATLVIISINCQVDAAFQNVVGSKRQRRLRKQQIFSISHSRDSLGLSERPNWENHHTSSLYMYSNGLSTLASSSSASSFAWAYMALLALQFGCQPLLTKAYTPKTIIRSTVVAAQEVVKLVSCFAALTVTHTWTISTEGWTLASWLLVAGVPAALYVVQNYCALIAYQHLPAVTFNVLNQTKTLSAALFCFFILGRKQSYWQVLALVFLLAAGLIIERVVPLPDFNFWRSANIQQCSNPLSESPLVSSFPEPSVDAISSAVPTEPSSLLQPQLWRKNDEIDLDKDQAHAHFTKGVLPVLMASLISGLAGALSQRALQIWDRNSYLFSLELSSASLLVLGSSLLLGSPDGRRIFKHQVDGDASGSWTERIREGWTWKTWIPITTNALGGVLVGLVTKYSGSVRKGFALIFGLLLSGILQNNFSNKGNDVNGGGVSTEQVVGGCLAALSLWIHSNFPHVPAPHL